MTERTALCVGRTAGGEVVVEIGGGLPKRLDPDDAAWLRDSLDEELKLLDGGEVGAVGAIQNEVSDPASMFPDEAAPSDGGDEDGEAGKSNAECGETYAGSRGVAIHRAKSHGDTAEDADGDGDGDESDDRDDRADGDESEDAHECEDCGATFGSLRALTTHTSQDSNDCGPDGAELRERTVEELPDHVDVEDVERACIEHTTFYELTDELRMSRSKIKRAVNRLGLVDALEEHGEAQARHIVEDVRREHGEDLPEDRWGATVGDDDAAEEVSEA
jgi:hypothetical protein